MHGPDDAKAAFRAAWEAGGGVRSWEKRTKNARADYAGL